MVGPSLRTDRLFLRRWVEADRTPFARMNADPEVCRFLPGMLSRTQSDALMDRIEEHFVREAFGLWCVEIPGESTCAGFVGLSRPSFDAAFQPCVEVGWRLASAHWGQGVATEAAREAIRFGFEELDLTEIVSFTVPANERSRSVMNRLGMSHDPDDDFDHPNLKPGDPLLRHVLYRLRAEEWTKSSGGPKPDL